MKPFATAISMAEGDPSFENGAIVCDKARAIVLRYFRAWQRQDAGAISADEVNKLGQEILADLVRGQAVVRYCATLAAAPGNKEKLEGYVTNLQFRINMVQTMIGSEDFDERMARCEDLINEFERSVKIAVA